MTKAGKVTRELQSYTDQLNLYTLGRPPCPLDIVQLHVGQFLLSFFLVSHHVGHLAHLHVGHHVSDHVGHRNVVLTLCEVSERLTELKPKNL